MTIRTGCKPAKGKAAAPGSATTKQRGDAAEALALAYLQNQGLRLVWRNFHTPGRGGGEVDLIMWDREQTLVFVEVRQRRGRSHGGAAASVSRLKQRRIVLAARHFLLRLPSLPACRFDVVAVQGEGLTADIEWLQGAFAADAT